MFAAWFRGRILGAVNEVIWFSTSIAVYTLGLYRVKRLRSSDRRRFFLSRRIWLPVRIAPKLPHVLPRRHCAAFETLSRMNMKYTINFLTLLAITALSADISFGAANPLPPASPPVVEDINVSILDGSTASELKLKIEGPVSSSNFGPGPVSDWIYLFTPGVEWSSGSFSTTIRNENFGTRNTAGEPEDYALFDGIVLGTGVEDAIGIQFEDGHPIEVGDVIDWTFEVRTFNQPEYDFKPLITADNLQAQIYSGAIPEPSNFAWMVSLTASACVLLRRRR